MLDIHLRGEEGSTELVTFSLAGDVYGLPVEYMLEVNRGLHWTKIPGAPEFVLGAANLRGQIVTIVDLRPILDYEENLEDKAGLRAHCYLPGGNCRNSGRPNR